MSSTGNAQPSSDAEAVLERKPGEEESAAAAEAPVVEATPAETSERGSATPAEGNAAGRLVEQTKGAPGGSSTTASAAAGTVVDTVAAAASGADLGELLLKPLKEVRPCPSQRTL